MCALQGWGRTVECEISFIGKVCRKEKKKIYKIRLSKDRGGYVKTVNVKRIAAAAAGAAMLGAAFAGAVSVDQAGLSGFQFFSNGSPNVVLVVGSASQPADAVNAANVAAMIGNLAYTSGEAITVTGTDLLSCTGSAGGAAKVSLEVATPGVNPALAFQIKSYVNDYVDENTDNVRNTTASFMSSFGTQTVTSLTFGGDPKVITQDHTQILSLPDSGKIANPKGFNIKEEQKVYVSANTVYDTGDHRLEAQSVRVGYETSFSDPIPACLDTTKPMTGCATSDLVTKNRVKITFLGDQWILIPSASGSALWSLTTGATTTSASSITAIGLGKEVQYNNFMQIGDETVLPDGKKVVLSDISGIGTGSQIQPLAKFDIYGADGTKLDTSALSESTNTYDANGVVIFVWKVFSAGFSGSNYVEVSIFANRLVIDQTAQKISGQGNWQGRMQSQNVSSSEGLQKIGLIDPLFNNPGMAAGESVQLIQNVPGLKLTFNGLDLTADDYDTLQFARYTNQSITVKTNGTTLSGDWLVITSDKSNAFFQTGQTDTSGVSIVYVLLNPSSATSDSVTTYNSTAVFYTNSSSVFISSGNIAPVDAGAATFANQVNTNTLTYYHSATDTATIRFVDAINGTGSTTLSNDAFVIAVPEGTEDSDTTSAVGTTTTGQPYWTIIYDQDARQFASDINSTTIGTNPFGYEANSAADATGDLVYGAFNTTGGVAFANVEAKYVSYRGSLADTYSTSAVTLKYAKKMGHGVYTLSKASTATVGNTATNDFSIGDKALDDSGYVVTVKDIMTGGASTGGVSGIDSLAPSIDNADSVVELDTSAMPLVVLDTSPYASGTTNVITFGGQDVNSVSASALAGAALTPGSEAVVKVVGNKIVVAGYDAAGTTQAANSLVAWLASSRDSIRG